MTATLVAGLRLVDVPHQQTAAREPDVEARLLAVLDEKVLAGAAPLEPERVVAELVNLSTGLDLGDWLAEAIGGLVDGGQHPPLERFAPRVVVRWCVGVVDDAEILA
jgi:hypothetical protein